MSAPFTRILSDVHFGDRASQVHQLAQLRPLLSEAEAFVFNGDTLDTRPGPNPPHTAECRTAVIEFARSLQRPVTFLTGNHDPDFSAQHSIALARGRVQVTHGDIAFDDIVPWGRDAAEIRTRIAAALTARNLPTPQSLSLSDRFALWREIASAIPQRHQSERNPIKYAFRFLLDTAWPPLRVFRILAAWRDHPALMGRIANAHWPEAKFILVGHTHRPGVRRLPSGLIVINTGSFTPPLGGCVVDIGSDRLVVRKVEKVRDEFQTTRTLAEFPLAAP